ncbi:hypothetical protein QT990_24895 [Microcoleus sp. T3_B1]
MERTEHTGSIEQIFQAHQPHLPWSGDFPEEAKQFFSLAFLWDRPKERKILAIPVFAGFKDYVAAYLDLVDRAEPVRSGAKLDSILTSSTVLSAVSCRKNPWSGNVHAVLRGGMDRRIHSRLFVQLGTQAGTIGK